MKHLLRYLKKYKWDCFLSPLLKLLESCFELFVPLVIAYTIDEGIQGGDATAINHSFWLLALLAAVGFGAALAAQYFAAHAAVGFAADVRKALFEKLLSLSARDVDRVGSTTMITRMTSDVQGLQNGVNLTLRLFLRSPCIVFGAMIMAFTVDPESGLIFLGVIPILAVIVFGIMMITVPLHKKVQKGLDALMGRLRSNLDGVRVLRAFRQEKDQETAFRNENTDLKKRQLREGFFSALTSPLTFLVINLATLLLIYTGTLQIEGGDLTAGQVVALYNYMAQILVELLKLANLIVTMTKAKACGDRVWAVLALPEDDLTKKIPSAEENRPVQTDAAVAFERVSLRFTEEAEPALSDISFAARKGQTVGIIGGTGAGKSALVNLIPRFYDASTGSVFVFGKDVRAYAPNELRAHIGIVEQKSRLFAGTIRENLLFGGKNATDDALWQALKIAQADKVVLEKGGLDAYVEQGGRNLSGGQRQRLCIARALVGDPEILILDDSASALDYLTDAALRKELRALSDTTVFIVSQRTASIRHADTILVLEDGRLAGMGSHEALLEGCTVYREIYDSQFKGGADR
ncbi:MAG: ABC transporter ATP-binding protein [Ruminococcaceae bacterium]|nr:ABC transporter ATP-binding protein [Oscillospiraceae bacterium]